jgi:hypothetical protein
MVTGCCAADGDVATAVDGAADVLTDVAWDTAGLPPPPQPATATATTVMIARTGRGWSILIDRLLFMMAC